MTLKFVIDQAYDAEMIPHMLAGPDWEFRASKMGLPGDLAKHLHQTDSPSFLESKKMLFEFVQKTYEKNLSFIEKTKTQYESSWNEMNDEFSRVVADLTHPWFHDEYICVVTHFNPGISDWHGNKIARWWQENPFTQRRITAHEIILAHFFSIHHELHKDSGLTDRQIWALAEITAFAMTGLEDQLKKFWPWDTRGYYTNHNYPQIVDLQNALKEPFLKRKNFAEYIEAGIAQVKKSVQT